MRALLAVGGSLVVVTVLLLLAYEALALATNSTTISDYVRIGIKRWPLLAGVLTLLVGILIGHFWSQ